MDYGRDAGREKSGGEEKAQTISSAGPAKNQAAEIVAQHGLSSPPYTRDGFHATTLVDV